MCALQQVVGGDAVVSCTGATAFPRRVGWCVVGSVSRCLLPRLRGWMLWCPAPAPPPFLGVWVGGDCLWAVSGCAVWADVWVGGRFVAATLVAASRCPHSLKATPARTAPARTSPPLTHNTHSRPCHCSNRWKDNNGPEQTDWVGARNLIAACPPSLRRFVLTTSAGVERSDQLPFSILNLFGEW